MTDPLHSLQKMVLPEEGLKVAECDFSLSAADYGVTNSYLNSNGTCFISDPQSLVSVSSTSVTTAGHVQMTSLIDGSNTSQDAMRQKTEQGITRTLSCENSEHSDKVTCSSHKFCAEETTNHSHKSPELIMNASPCETESDLPVSYSDFPKPKNVACGSTEVQQLDESKFTVFRENSLGDMTGYEKQKVFCANNVESELQKAGTGRKGSKNDCSSSVPKTCEKSSGRECCTEISSVACTRDDNVHTEDCVAGSSEVTMGQYSAIIEHKEESCTSLKNDLPLNDNESQTSSEKPSQHGDLLLVIENSVVKDNAKSDVHDVFENEKINSEVFVMNDGKENSSCVLHNIENSSCSSKSRLSLRAKKKKDGAFCAGVFLNNKTKKAHHGKSTSDVFAKSNHCSSDTVQKPVKVIIHRIKTNSSKDTWHVPKSGTEHISHSGSAVTSSMHTTSVVSKHVEKLGPQIIVLSPAASKRKNEMMTLNSGKNAPCSSAVSAKRNRKKKSRKCNAKRKDFLAKPLLDDCLNNEMYKQRISLRSCREKKTLTMKQKKTSKEIKVLAQTNVQKTKKTKVSVGPYVHVTDSNLFTVVNVTAAKATEKDKRYVQTKTTAEISLRRSHVGHTSTLSPHYDAFNTDRSWVCVFCHKGSHFCGLGDLFGPYYIKETPVAANVADNSLQPYQSDARYLSNTKRASSKRRRYDTSFTDFQKAWKKSKQVKKNIPDHSYTDSVSGPKAVQPLMQGPVQKEIWVHEDCAVWCQTVYLGGHQVQGLEEAVEESRASVCCLCRLFGATIGCWHKGCTEKYHFACATQKGCHLDIGSFSLFCPRHIRK